MVAGARSGPSECIVDQNSFISGLGGVTLSRSNAAFCAGLPSAIRNSETPSTITSPPDQFRTRPRQEIGDQPAVGVSDEDEWAGNCDGVDQRDHVVDVLL